MEDPATWELYQPYLANLPAEDDVYTLYNFRRDHISLLQDPEMVRRSDPTPVVGYHARHATALHPLITHSQ